MLCSEMGSWSGWRGRGLPGGCQSPCAGTSWGHGTDALLAQVFGAFLGEMAGNIPAANVSVSKRGEKKSLAYINSVWMVNNVERRKCRRAINKLRLHLVARM